MSASEINSRQCIFWDQSNMDILVEAYCMIPLYTERILPVVFRAQTQCFFIRSISQLYSFNNSAQVDSVFHFSKEINHSIRTLDHLKRVTSETNTIKK